MKFTNYLKLFLMLAVSYAIMYAVMFLNVFSFSHIYTSYTRAYMTLLMVAPMAILKLIFMWKMYSNRTINIAVITAAILIFVLSFIGLREQVGIRDIQYMKAMIPHHSSAILTSENAKFDNPEVQQLANDIIEAQKREIELMKEIIEKTESK